MFLQKDTYFNNEINRYGCYFFSLVYLSSQKASRSFSKGDVSFFYEEFVDRGWMTENCYVLEPVKILRYLNLKVSSVYKTEGHDPSGDNYEILCFERSYKKDGKEVSYNHFVVGDGLGHVAYDPIGLSNAVKDGFLESKRVFIKAV